MENMIASITSLGTLIVSICGLCLVKNESKRWRNQKRTERQAEVAGKAFIAIGRYLTALESFSGVIGNSEENSNSNERIKKTLDEIWDKIKSFDKEFHDGWIKTEAYLPEKAQKLFEEIWQFKQKILNQQKVWVYNLDSGLPNQSAFENSYGDKVRNQIEVFRNQSKNILRPFSLYEKND